MPCDPLQLRQFSAQFLQQSNQAVYLCHRVRVSHNLPARVKPIRVTTVVDQFNSNAALIETLYVMGGSLQRNPLFNPAISFYIVMSRIAGTGFRIVNALTIIPRCRQVRKLGAVDDDKVYGIKRPGFQARHVGQVILINGVQSNQPSRSKLLKSIIAALAREM